MVYPSLRGDGTVVPPYEGLLMAWTETDSTMFRRYDYDADMQVLHLQFVSGRIASYQRVPPNVAADFASAPSKGKFFHANLRDQYVAL